MFDNVVRGQIAQVKPVASKEALDRFGSVISKGLEYIRQNELCHVQSSGFFSPLKS